MDTRRVTREVRLRHWAEIIRQRQASGQTVRGWCEENGVIEKTYYYWQRKLREAACEQMTEYQPSPRQTGLTALGFAEVRLDEPTGHPPLTETVSEGQLHIAVGGIRISADAGYPTEKLAAVLRELVRPC